MVDQFENSAVPFNDELAQQIKTQIQSQLNKIQGSTENMEGWNRAKYLLRAQKLTGLELKQLKHYIDELPRNAQGQITDPVYAMIGGNALNTFVQQAMLRLRHQINTADANEEKLGKTEKQDVTPPSPPNIEQTTGLPKLGLALDKLTDLNEELIKIKNLILY
jgi:hypothetical protein